MSQGQQKKKRITVRIQKPYLDALDRLLQQIHIRRDAYLNHVFPGEVESLEELEPNTEKSAKYVRQLRGALSNKVRIAVTLEKSLVERMNKACAKKGIVRDAFIENFIRFLALGDEEHGSCISPLVKVAELLCNPRHEYDFSHHPYEDLSMSDEVVDAVLRLPRDLSRFFEGGNDEK